jgi:hypothetical protein
VNGQQSQAGQLVSKSAHLAAGSGQTGA